MASNESKGSPGFALGWVVLTPVLLVVAAFSIIGIFLIPALCLYLDGRSRTYTGAAVVLAASVAASLFLGPGMAAVCAFAVITTASAYVLARIKLPHDTALAGSALGGILGAMALLGIMGASLGRPLSEVGADRIYEALNISYYDINLWDPWTLVLKQIEEGRSLESLWSQYFQGSIQPQVFTDAERAAAVIPFLKALMNQSLPGLALVTGLFTGGLGYYLPMAALQAHRRLAGQDGAGAVAVPPFSAFRFPKYIVITVFALEMIASFGAESTGFATLYVAGKLLFDTMMTAQALAFLSFLLGRRQVPGWLQWIILTPALLLLFWLLPFVGFFDALFDMRSVMTKVDALKAKGRRVFTQDGLNELRRMDQARKDDQNGKDGEDDEK